MKQKNLILLEGRLGADPAIKYAASGLAICNFNIAISEGYKDAKSGEWVQKATWHRIVCFDALAVEAEQNQSIRKGSLVLVEGKLQTRTYTDAGIEKHITEVIANEIYIPAIGVKSRKKAGSQNSKDQNQSTESREQSVPTGDDLPF
jgi:single-strand DNA-binding protein